MDDSLKRLLAKGAATKSRNSIWELTWDYLPTLDITDPPADAALPTPLYEVGIAETYTQTSPDVFDAWTGPRRLNGQDYHGPVFTLGANLPYEGPRHCGCPSCETNTHPTAKKN